MAFLKCNDCGKLCNGIQGIRGHRRNCPGRIHVSLNQFSDPHDPVVEPGIPVVGALKQQITLGTRLDVKGVEVVLRIYEAVHARRERLRDSLPIRLVSNSPARAPTYDDWYSLGRNLVRLELACERILQQAFVSRDEPWALYQLAIQTRDRWVLWRREEAQGAWKQRCVERVDADKPQTRIDFEDICADFGIPELEDDWNRVIEGLRWLIAHTRATL